MTSVELTSFQSSEGWSLGIVTAMPKLGSLSRHENLVFNKLIYLTIQTYVKELAIECLTCKWVLMDND